MHRLEHIVALHPQRGQLVDVEEAPVVHLVARRAPPCQPVMLPLQQRVQPFDAAVAAFRPCRPLRGCQRMAARRQRQSQPVMTQRRPLIVHCHAQHAIAHGVVQWPVQHRQPEPAIAAGRLPVNVEPSCMGTSAPVQQHIVPPGRLRGCRKIVGYDVQDQAHAMRARRCRQSLEGFFAAQFRIDAGRVDAIIAMRGPGHRGGDRGQVKVADAQRGVVRQLRSSGLEVEACMQLQACGGTQPGHCPAFRRMALNRAIRASAASGSRASGKRRRQFG